MCFPSSSIPGSYVEKKRAFQAQKVLKSALFRHLCCLARDRVSPVGQTDTSRRGAGTRRRQERVERIERRSLDLGELRMAWHQQVPSGLIVEIRQSAPPFAEAAVPAPAIRSEEKQTNKSEDVRVI